MELTSSDIEYLVDAIGVSVVIICFCLGWIAGSFR